MTAVPTPATTNASPPPPLWPNGFSLPFIAVTGDFGSGKTLFGLMIDPSRCVHFDFEKSAETYQQGLQFTRVDMQQRAREKYGNARLRPIDLFKMFREIYTSLPPGRFRVAVVDDVSSLEEGLVEYVRANPAEFGYTAGQFAKSEAMVWAAVKSHYKALLLANGIETVVLVCHQRQQFVAGKPTGRREPKGKETVMELSSLFLELDRKPDDKGRTPTAPNATCLKNRLSVFTLNPQTGEMEPRPVLPPRMSACSPAKIRAYMQAPPDYSKLKADERPVAPAAMTDDERAQLAAQTAADMLATEQAKGANLLAVAQIRAQANPAQVPQATTPPNSDQSGAIAAARATEAKVQAAWANQQAQQRTAEVHAQQQQPQPAQPQPQPTHQPAPATQPQPAPQAATPTPEPPPFDAPGDTLDTSATAVAMIDDAQFAEIARLVKEVLQMPPQAWQTNLAKRRHPQTGQPCAKARDLSYADADDLIGKLHQLARKQSDAAQLTAWANDATAQPQAQPYPQPLPQQTAPGGGATGGFPASN
jgi:hypothetical protein